MLGAFLWHSTLIQTPTDQNKTHGVAYFFHFLSLSNHPWVDLLLKNPEIWILSLSVNQNWQSVNGYSALKLDSFQKYYKRPSPPNRRYHIKPLFVDSGGLWICHLEEKSNENPKISFSIALEACLSKKKTDKVVKIF